MAQKCLDNQVNAITTNTMMLTSLRVLNKLGIANRAIHTTCIHKCRYMHVCTHTHIYTHAFTYVQMHMYMCAYIYIFTRCSDFFHVDFLSL